jgi:hypothetical protein
MPDQNISRDSSPETGASETPSDAFQSEVKCGMTLESIIDLTGEFAHLNELVMLHLGKAGGVTSQQSYFTTVTPILDLLEAEIRFRYRAGMGKNDMKLLVQDWIDREIAGMR